MSHQKTEHSRAAWRKPATLFLAIVILSAGLAGVLLGFVTTRPDNGEVSVAYGTWALALFTFVLAVGIPVTIWLSTKEREESSVRFLEQEQDRFYAQLDGTYLEIQKLIIDHPHLGDPGVLLRNPEAEPEQLTQYDAFAFIVWNFIESIHDFTRKGEDSPQGRRMTETLTQSWECIVEYEGARHAQWFVRPENQQKFKKTFRDYVASQREGWSAKASARPTA